MAGVIFPLIALAAPQEATLPEHVAKSVVVLSGNGACGSGVVLDTGFIATNAHVTKGICPNRDCRGVKILNSWHIDSPPLELATDGILVVHEIESIDLALLNWHKPQGIVGLPISQKSAHPGASVYSLGFSGCKGLEWSSGKVISINGTRIESSAKVFKGGSGGALLDQEFSLVGITRGSTGIYAFAVSLYHQFIAPLHVRMKGVGTPIHEYQDLFSSQPEFSYLAELRMLNSHAHPYLANLPLLGRYLESLKFGVALDSAIKRGLKEQICRNLDPIYRSYELHSFEHVSFPEASVAHSYQACALVEVELKKAIVLARVESGASAFTPDAKVYSKDLTDFISSYKIKNYFGILVPIGLLIVGTVTAVVSCGLASIYTIRSSRLRRRYRLVIALFLTSLPIFFMLGALLLLARVI